MKGLWIDRETGVASRNSAYPEGWFVRYPCEVLASPIKVVLGKGIDDAP